jgi:hypothetical protein
MATRSRRLAAVNIFAGDLLFKNFGVTRFGRVVFYDYDEIEYLTDCNFRKIPPPPPGWDEMSGDVWYPVGPHDVFPEEFETFLLTDPRTRSASSISTPTCSTPHGGRRCNASSAAVGRSSPVVPGLGAVRAPGATRARHGGARCRLRNLTSTPLRAAHLYATTSCRVCAATVRRLPMTNLFQRPPCIVCCVDTVRDRSILRAVHNKYKRHWTHRGQGCSSARSSSIGSASAVVGSYGGTDARGAALRPRARGRRPLLPDAPHSRRSLRVRRCTGRDQVPTARSCPASGDPPDAVDPATLAARAARIHADGQLPLAGTERIPFDPASDIVFHVDKAFAFHSNALRFTARNARGETLATRLYFSTGDGEVVADSEAPGARSAVRVPYPFTTAAELLAQDSRTARRWRR